MSSNTYFQSICVFGSTRLRYFFVSKMGRPTQIRSIGLYRTDNSMVGNRVVSLDGERTYVCYVWPIIPWSLGVQATGEHLNQFQLPYYLATFSHHHSNPSSPSEIKLLLTSPFRACEWRGTYSILLGFWYLSDMPIPVLVLINCS